MWKSILGKGLTLLLLLAGCTDIDIQDPLRDSGKGRLQVNYVWNCQDSERPGAVYLFASRLLNTYHTYFVMSNDGRFIEEQPYAGAGEYAGSEDETAGDELPVGGQGMYPLTWDIYGGEYSLLAIGQDTTVVKSSSIPNRELFVLYPEVIGMKDLYLEYNVLPDSMMPRIDGKQWNDMYPGYRIVDNCGRLFMGKNTSVNIAGGESVTSAEVKMEQLTQHISVDFDVVIENSSQCTVDVDTSEVVVELAGIVPKINLVDRTFSTTEMARMFLNGSMVRTGDNRYHYSGVLDAPGLMPGGNSEVVSGPGVMRTGIMVHITDNVNNRKFPYLLKAALNISDEITRLNLTDPTEQDSIRSQKVLNAGIRVEKQLVVLPDELLNGGDGISGWTEENIDQEI